MRIALITRDNGVGLSTDVQVLRGWLESIGHEVSFVDWRSRVMRRCDAAIFLELLNPMLFRYAQVTVGIFNLEWFIPAWKRYLPKITQLWAKSRESEEVYRELGLASAYTGFIGRDFLDSSVERTLTCLHVRGRSTLKGTDKVLEAWHSNSDLPPLTVISHAPIDVPAGVRLLPRIDVDQLKYEMNAHAIHVCPSISEGWGHYIAEGLSTGAIVVTTDASPMNEHVQSRWGYLAPATSGGTRHLVIDHHADPGGIAERVRGARDLTGTERAEMSRLARVHFEERNAQFRSQVAALLDEAVTHSVELNYRTRVTHPTHRVRSKYSSIRGGGAR